MPFPAGARHLSRDKIAATLGHDHPLRRHRALAIAAGIALLVSTGGRAVELQQGQIYEGGTRLEAADLGIAFTVPAEWRGTWPAGSEVFVLQPEADPDVLILAIGDEATREELATHDAPA